MNEREQHLADLMSGGLDQQVSGLHGTPLDLGAVQRRARSVRRRRRGAAAGVVALVAAVVVPVTLSLGDGTDRSQGIDPAGVPSAPSVAVDPEGVEDTGNAGGAGEPLPYLQGAVVTLGDGRTVDTGLPPASIQQLAVLDDDRVVVAVTGASDSGGGEVVVVPADGGEAARYPVGDTLALRTSPDRSLVAWTDDTDRPQVLESGVADPAALAPLSQGDDVGSLVVGVGGSDCAAGGCRVWAVTGASTDVVGDADGVEELDTPAGVDLTDVYAPDGDVVLMAGSERSDGGEQVPCAVLLEPDGTQRARTCETAFLRFSPDGTRLQGATYENDTTSTVTVVDTDLQVVATISPTASTLSRIAWQDDASLVAVELTYTGNRASWSLVRYTVADPGAPQVVVGPVRAPDFPALFRVPT